MNCGLITTARGLQGGRGTEPDHRWICACREPQGEAPQQAGDRIHEGPG